MATLLSQSPRDLDLDKSLWDKKAIEQAIWELFGVSVGNDYVARLLRSCNFPAQQAKAIPYGIEVREAVSASTYPLDDLLREATLGKQREAGHVGLHAIDIHVIEKIKKKRKRAEPKQLGKAFDRARCVIYASNSKGYISFRGHAFPPKNSEKSRFIQLLATHTSVPMLYLYPEDWRINKSTIKVISQKTDLVKFVRPIGKFELSLTG
jgi:hypothetical protein